MRARLVLTVVGFALVSVAFGGPNTITYQGSVVGSDGKPVIDRDYRMRFRLFNVATGGTALWSEEETAVSVRSGLFAVTLGDGPQPFGNLFMANANLWLEVAIDLNRDGTFQSTEVYAPRQKLACAAWAMSAGDADTLDSRHAAGLVWSVAAGTGLARTGTVNAPTLSADTNYLQRRVTGSAPAGRFIRAINADGSVVTSAAITGVVAGGGLTGGGASGSVSLAVRFGGAGTSTSVAHADHSHPGGVNWSLAGNTGTTSGTHFLGTTDYAALDFRTSNTRALRIEPNEDSPNLIGGHPENSVGPDVAGATIAGGGESGWPNVITRDIGTISGGERNTVSGPGGSIGGGAGNTAGSNFDTVGGGSWNRALGSGSTVAGGTDSTASGVVATVGGGISNWADGWYSTIGGGRTNTIGELGDHATIGGGWSNSAITEGATVGGGYSSTAFRYGTVAGGYANWASEYAVVAGGQENTAFGQRAAVGGGQSNYAGGEWATIAGGYSNQASAPYTTVGGGGWNTASGDRATIGGGVVNTASGDFASVAGGSGNAASGRIATVGGGGSNTASNPYATVGGGGWNAAGDYGASVGGGTSNMASGYAATVAGGMNNFITGLCGTIAGGGTNNVSGTYATVGGGYWNQATDNSATVGGGQSNYAGGDWATVGGGQLNSAGGTDATVGGGSSNQAGGIGATIGGGQGNQANGYLSVIGGGDGNATEAADAVVPGGFHNVAAAQHTFAAGFRAQALHEGTFVWSDSSPTSFSSTGANQFLVRATGGVGINTNMAGGFGLRVGGMVGFDGQLDMAADGSAARIVGVANPINPQDAANKLYVDSAVLGPVGNADTLDGQHGTFYQDATNINAGTLGNSFFSAYSNLTADGRLDNNDGADLLTRSQADGRYNRFRWMDTTSGTFQAEPNWGYVARADPATLTLPPSASLATGDIVGVNGSGGGAGGFQIAQNAGQKILIRNLGLPNYSATWTAREAARDWYGIASSADGAKLVACVNNGLIYTSSDGGVTWTARENNRAWRSVASSADGVNLVACVRGGQIYTSSDSGVIWTARENNRNWQSVASSADGSKLVACVNFGQIYTSGDYGVTWAPQAFAANWDTVASSADGTHLVACISGGLIYVSVDSGLTWNGYGAALNWDCVASSGDGTKMVACVNGGQIYTSTDSGQTWTARESNRNWIAVASSGDGARLVACVNNGQIYTSSDSGLTWTPREINRKWAWVCSSEDGTRLGACVTAGGVPPGGQIYTFDFLLSETTAGTSGYLRAYPKAAVELQYVGSDTFAPLSFAGRFSAK